MVDQDYATQINSNQDISIMIRFLEENIKSKLQLKYIYIFIRFKLYGGGYIKDCYSQQQTQKKKKKKKSRGHMKGFYSPKKKSN